MFLPMLKVGLRQSCSNIFSELKGTGIYSNRSKKGFRIIYFAFTGTALEKNGDSKQTNGAAAAMSVSSSIASFPRAGHPSSIKSNRSCLSWSILDWKHRQYIHILLRRGPNMMKHIRSLDRSLNQSRWSRIIAFSHLVHGNFVILFEADASVRLYWFPDRYPYLFYPEMYLMKGGYKEFFNKDSGAYQVLFHS